jgi:pSer/pThr/pTyr-binding forkhead associated (FHA) protein
MVELEILTGKKAGAHWVARRFPVRIGRAASSDLQLEEDGVWDEHLRIDFVPAEGFLLETQSDALASVNGQPVEHVILRNGDLIGLGSLKLQFWLGEARQRGLGVREWFVWIGIGAVCLGQVALIYWLLR